MSGQKNSISASFPQFFAFSFNNIDILQEVILWEKAVVESIGGCRCLNSRKTDDADSDSALELVEMGNFLVRQEDVLPFLGPNVGSKTGCLF